MRSSFLIGGLTIAAAAILGLTFYLRQAEQPVVVTEPLTAPAAEPEAVSTPVPEPTLTDQVMEQTPPSPTALEPQLVLPTLDGSDGFVRDRLPESWPAVWLEKEDLLRRLAVLVDNASRGELPRRQLDFLVLDGRYPVLEVVEADGQTVRFFVDPDGFARFDPYLELLERIPSETLATLLTDVYPLLDAAMLELGTAEQVLPQLLAAIDQVLAVPVLRGDVELVQPKVFFEYADPALEGLSDLQKQVLRAGPDNVLRLQEYLKTLRTGLLRR
ncbi:MAG: DUF3014 domain-containing protein [Pseudomonadota bacterium]